MEYRAEDIAAHSRHSRIPQVLSSRSLPLLDAVARRASIALHAQRTGETRGLLVARRAGGDAVPDGSERGARSRTRGGKKCGKSRREFSRCARERHSYEFITRQWTSRTKPMDGYVRQTEPSSSSSSSPSSCSFKRRTLHVLTLARELNVARFARRGELQVPVRESSGARNFCQRFNSCAIIAGDSATDRSAHVALQPIKKHLDCDRHRTRA